MKAAMGKMSLPDADLAAENAALRAKVSQLEAENAALRAKLEPPLLHKELEQTLGRDAIWALVRPEAGKDSRSVLERHGEIWERFDNALEAVGIDGSNVLRKPLQDYLDALVELEFTRDDKKKITARLNLMMRSLGVKAQHESTIGTLAGYGSRGAGGFRLQYCDKNVGGGRVYKGLGPTMPSGVKLSEGSRRDRTLGRYKHL